MDSEEETKDDQLNAMLDAWERLKIGDGRRQPLASIQETAQRDDHLISMRENDVNGNENAFVGHEQEEDEEDREEPEVTPEYFSAPESDDEAEFSDCGNDDDCVYSREFMFEIGKASFPCPPLDDDIKASLNRDAPSLKSIQSSKVPSSYTKSWEKAASKAAEKKKKKLQATPWKVDDAAVEATKGPAFMPTQAEQSTEGRDQDHGWDVQLLAPKWKPMESEEQRMQREKDEEGWKEEEGFRNEEETKDRDRRDILTELQWTVGIRPDHYKSWRTPCNIYYRLPPKFEGARIDFGPYSERKMQRWLRQGWFHEEMLFFFKEDPKAKDVVTYQLRDLINLNGPAAPFAFASTSMQEKLDEEKENDEIVMARSWLESTAQKQQQEYTQILMRSNKALEERKRLEAELIRRMGNSTG